MNKWIDCSKLGKEKEIEFSQLLLSMFGGEVTKASKVDDIYNNKVHDIYVIKDDLGKQILLPSTKEVIKDIDIDNDKIVVHLINGLI